MKSCTIVVHGGSPYGVWKIEAWNPVAELLICQGAVRGHFHLKVRFRCRWCVRFVVCPPPPPPTAGCSSHDVFTFLRFYVFTFLRFYVFAFLRFYVFTFLRFCVFAFLRFYVLLYSCLFSHVTSKKARRKTKLNNVFFAPMASEYGENVHPYTGVRFHRASR